MSPKSATVILALVGKPFLENIYQEKKSFKFSNIIKYPFKKWIGAIFKKLYLRTLAKSLIRRGIEKNFWVSIQFGFTEALKKTNPDFYKVLIKERNQTWTMGLLESTKKDKSILVFGGAGHFYGSDSLFEKLRENNFKIFRRKVLKDQSCHDAYSSQI